MNAFTPTVFALWSAILAPTEEPAAQEEESHRAPDAAPSGPTNQATRGGQKVRGADEWTFDFHGFINAPMRVGIGRRANPEPGEKRTTFHAPLIPDDQYLSAQHTRHNSRSWTELYFSYGNRVARATAAVEAFNFTDVAWNDFNAQLGIGQGFVTLTPRFERSKLRLRWKVGAFDNRYGQAGKYDAGEYETYLFGRTRAMGETLRLELPVKKFNLWFEHGLGATRPHPSVWNTSRFTLLHHAHAGTQWNDIIDVGFHYLHAFAQEEDRDGDMTPDLPDGRMIVLGPELRADVGKFGYYYGGFSYIQADHARVVGPSIEVLHGQGGGNFSLGIVDNYIEGPTGASEGSGQIYSVLLQTQHSLHKILEGERFWGEAWDLKLTLYSMLNFVSSKDPDMDGHHKLKYGADLLYTPLSWMGVATRFDRVQPNSKVPEQSFAILSPRIVFRSDWLTHEQITLQYSRYFYNQRTCDPMGSPLLCVQAASAPPIPDGFGATSEDQNDENKGAPDAPPDLNAITISASIWW